MPWRKRSYTCPSCGGWRLQRTFGHEDWDCDTCDGRGVVEEDYWDDDASEAGESADGHESADDAAIDGDYGPADLSMLFASPIDTAGEIARERDREIREGMRDADRPTVRAARATTAIDPDRIAHTWSRADSPAVPYDGFVATTGQIREMERRARELQGLDATITSPLSAVLVTLARARGASHDEIVDWALFGDSAWGVVAGLAGAPTNVRMGALNLLVEHHGKHREPSRSVAFDAAANRLIDRTRSYFDLPKNPTRREGAIVGVLIGDNHTVYPLRSGAFGGPTGGTHLGGFPTGPGSGFTGHTKTHVEGHAAATMWQAGIKKAILILEREPCGGCDAPFETPNISAMLPPDAQLVVVSPETSEYFRSKR